MMASTHREPRLIVIGCGTAGTALAARLRSQLNYTSFVNYEREADVGGTWYLNTYPGVGCDVDSHLYSFSFNLNPNWSTRFAEQGEILSYLNSTVDKFGVRPHVRLRVEVTEAWWESKGQVWRVGLRDMETGHTFYHEAEMLVSCVGTISIPKDCDIPGHESYKGAIFHSARWDHSFDTRGKRVAVVGNGCSGAQIMPHLADSAASVVQFQRSPQWINDRPNPKFSKTQKWLFRNVPLYGRAFRYRVWKNTDALHTLYLTGSEELDKQRADAQKEAEAYMRSTAPAKYLDMLIPKFPLGYKRRVFDPGYLACLHKNNVELTTERVQGFTETGLVTSSQRQLDFDAVVLSTGFKIQEFLSPISVTGKGGEALNQHRRRVVSQLLHQHRGRWSPDRAAGHGPAVAGGQPGRHARPRDPDPGRLAVHKLPLPAVELIRAGLVDIKPFITHCYELDDVVEALELALRRPPDLIKCLLVTSRDA